MRRAMGGRGGTGRAEAGRVRDEEVVGRGGGGMEAAP